MTDIKDEDNMMPVWKDNDHLDLEWLRDKIQLPCTKCQVEDISNATRKGETTRNGATLKLTLTLENSKEPLSFVVKQVPEQGRPLSQRLGLAREALFYKFLAGDVEAKQQGKNNRNDSKIIPKILYSYGNMESGAKVVIMEDLSSQALDSGVFFGPGNPNNWKRDLPAIVARAGPNPPSAAQVARATFVELAKVHAAFWTRKDLLDDKYSFLRAHAWFQGKGKASWEASQNMIQNFWKKTLDQEKETGKESLDWDPLVRSAVETGIKGISWEAQLKRLHTDGRWTVVHGDCWPGNFMWMVQKDDTGDSSQNAHLKLLDWEMVGIGSGPQDLGQYVLSNMDPTEREESEKDLIQAYFDELKRCGVEDVDWEYCWGEYKLGGVERWLWFLIYFVGMGMNDWAQFFHNQIKSFMHHHTIKAEDIVQPRP